MPRTFATVLCAVVASSAAASILAAGSGSPDQVQATRAALQKARASLADHFADVQARGAPASELLARLDADLNTVSQKDAPLQDWAAFSLVAQLDESLVNQAVSGSYVQLGDVRGAASVLVKASADNTLQPLAVYVPRSFDAKRPSPLVLMLHGQGQTENDLLATPFLRTLADQTDAIFAAPFARGDRGFDGAAASDVYDAQSVLENAFDIDRRRIYLSGVSLGGFGVFMVAPMHADRWSALMAIAGTLTNGDKEDVVRGMAGKQVFLVVGADDPRIKAEYVRGAAAYLLANGVDGRLYEQPRGVHSLQSLQPAVERAWRDMLSGMRNVAPETRLPSPQPRASLRP